MDNLKIKIAETNEDFVIIEKLANKIWKQHYTSIIGEAQVSYMLDKFQSVKAMQHQVTSEGFEYYSISLDGVAVGYLAVKPETDALFLSKIYVLDACRGKGLGREAMQFVKNKAIEYHLKHIRLTVNIHNRNAIKAYKKMGFVNKGSKVTDIGNGYIMDDYEMIRAVI